MQDNSFMVVIDPTLQHQPAFERALQSAQLTGSPLHLFQCVYYDNAISCKGDDDEQKQQIMNYYQQQLVRLKQIANDMDIRATIELAWQQSWGRAVIDAATKNEAFMVFKSSYFHTHAERGETTADWTLLRESPCPVLLMHNHSLWGTRKVLAAVNLAAEDKEHQVLNQKVIDTALSFRETYNADVHFVNSVREESKEHLEHIIDDSDDLLFDTIPTAQAAKKNQGDFVVDQAHLMEHCQSDEEHVHIEQGEATEAILAVAAQLKVDLIIVGTAARKGIKGRVIGNTAEKLLDETKSDILTLS